MAIGIITGCQFYSGIIRDAVDYAKDRAGFPKSTYEICKLLDDYDVDGVVSPLTDDRNTSGANAQKPLPYSDSSGF